MIEDPIWTIFQGLIRRDFALSEIDFGHLGSEITLREFRIYLEELP